MSNGIINKTDGAPRETNFITFTPESMSYDNLHAFFSDMSNIKEVMPGKDRKKTWDKLKDNVATDKLTNSEKSFLQTGVNLFNALTNYILTTKSGGEAKEAWNVVRSQYNNLDKSSKSLIMIGELTYAYFIVKYVRAGKVSATELTPEKLAALVIAAMRNQSVMRRDSSYQVKTPNATSDEEGSGLRTDKGDYIHFNQQATDSSNIRRDVVNEGSKKKVYLVSESQFKKIVNTITG